MIYFWIGISVWIIAVVLHAFFYQLLENIKELNFCNRMIHFPPVHRETLQAVKVQCERMISSGLYQYSSLKPEKIIEYVKADVLKQLGAEVTKNAKIEVQNRDEAWHAGDNWPDEYGMEQKITASIYIFIPQP